MTAPKRLTPRERERLREEEITYRRAMLRLNCSKLAGAICAAARTSYQTEETAQNQQIVYSIIATLATNLMRATNNTARLHHIHSHITAALDTHAPQG